MDAGHCIGPSRRLNPTLYRRPQKRAGLLAEVLQESCKGRKYTREGYSTANTSLVSPGA